MARSARRVFVKASVKAARARDSVGRFGRVRLYRSLPFAESVEICPACSRRQICRCSSEGVRSLRRQVPELVGQSAKEHWMLGAATARLSRLRELVSTGPLGVCTQPPRVVPPVSEMEAETKRLREQEAGLEGTRATLERPRVRHRVSGAARGGQTCPTSVRIVRMPREASNPGFVVIRQGRRLERSTQIDVSSDEDFVPPNCGWYVVARRSVQDEVPSTVPATPVPSAQAGREFRPNCGRDVLPKVEGIGDVPTFAEAGSVPRVPEHHEEAQVAVFGDEAHCEPSATVAASPRALCAAGVVLENRFFHLGTESDTDASTEEIVPVRRRSSRSALVSENVAGGHS